jgi:hypothetical protein
LEFKTGITGFYAVGAVKHAAIRTPIARIDLTIWIRIATHIMNASP